MTGNRALRGIMGAIMSGSASVLGPCRVGWTARSVALGLSLVVVLAACGGGGAEGPREAASAGDEEVTNIGDEGDGTATVPARDPGAPVEAAASIVGGAFFAIVDGQGDRVKVPFSGELIRIDVADGDIVSEGDALGLLATDRSGSDDTFGFGRFQPLDRQISEVQLELVRANRAVIAARREIQGIELLDEVRRQFSGDFPDREAERFALISTYEADLRRGRAVTAAASRADVIGLLEAVIEEQEEWEDALSKERSALADADRLRDELIRLRKARDGRVLRAPQDGVFRFFDDRSGVNRAFEVGDVVSVGRGFGTVFPLDASDVIVYVPERFISSVSQGDRVDIELEAFPGRTLLGTVDDISNVGSSESRTRTFEFFVGPDVFMFDPDSGGNIRRDIAGMDLSGSRVGPAQSVFALGVSLDDGGRPAMRPGLTGIASVGSGQDFEAVAEVSELDIHRVKVGDRAEVELAAAPGATLDGGAGALVPLRSGLRATVVLPSS